MNLHELLQFKYSSHPTESSEPVFEISPILVTSVSFPVTVHFLKIFTPEAVCVVSPPEHLETSRFRSPVSVHWIHQKPSVTKTTFSFSSCSCF